jgi:catechol 2,3-dioxygenase-like lactoylglutathione lyase family enzyme
MTQFNFIAPTFPVADVGRTAHWYEDVLGFALGGHFPEQEPYAWASLQRDGVELMLLRIEDYQKPDISHLRPEGLWDAYIRVTGVREYYESVRQKARINLELRKQGYGDWEFEVIDLNGYVLVFSELVD